MISLNTSTSYKGTGSVLLDAQRTGLQSVGIKQHLKSFFNFGTARAENLDTLMAVRTAIRLDPRFSSTDIQDHADRLLAEVRTDRAIDVSRIKGIVEELEKIAFVSGSNIGKRVDLHVAAGDYSAEDELSDFIDKHADQVAFVAKQRANNLADVAQAATTPAKADYVPVDVAGCVKEAATNCRAVLDSVSNVPDANTRDLVDFVGKHLDQFVLKNDLARRPNTFRTPVEIGYIGKFCGQASRGGHSWIHEDHPGTAVLDEPERVKPYEMAAVEFLAAAGKPVPPSLYGSIDRMVRSFLTDQQLTSSLFQKSRSRGFSADAIKDSLASVMRRMLSTIDSHADLKAFCTDNLGKDVKAFEALGRYVAKLVAMRLPADVSKGICEKLQVQSADVAFETAARDAVVNELY